MVTRRGSDWAGRVGLALVVGAAALSAALLAEQAVRPVPLRGAGLVVDRLSASLGLLVTAVGAAVYRFALRYLDGEPGRGAFLRRLTATVAAAYVLMLADHLLVLFAAWFAMGLGLHTLLTYYRDRPEAYRPARKKFLISRLGDLALVAAIGLIGARWGTLSVTEFLAAVPAGGDGWALGAVGVLIALAALTKSAQFPFHSWLPETMEAPTPVSALMHAGVINAGGALLLRFAPVVVRVPAALLLLSAVGTVTAVLGLTAMWAQVKVKRTLAWSTVGQMGFMTVQCGLGAFPAAWLHVLGHGLYKAWSFLRSGELPAATAAKAPVAPTRALALAVFGTALAVPVLGLASWVTGFHYTEAPGELALGAVVALSVGQVWVGLIGPGKDLARALAAAAAATLGVPVVAFALYAGAGAFLAPVLGPVPAPQGVAAWVAAALPVAALAGLTVAQAVLPAFGRTAAGRAFYVHALNGFYVGAVADRLVDRVWAGVGRTAKGVQGA